MMNTIIIFGQKLFLTLESFSVYLLLGFFLSALLRLFIKPNTIQKLMGKRNAMSVVTASLIGVPMPLCSCSVIPVGVSLRKSGASDGATLSFLTSTPVTGVDSIAMSMAMLPPPLVIARPIVALILGLLSGFLQILFFKDDTKSISQNSEESTASFKDNLKECVNYVIFDLFPSLANTLFIGVILAAILLTGIELKLFPDIGTISTGSMILDMVIVILMGIPVYVCATGSTPIAAAFIMAGMKPELAFVFLIAGPATNITTISTVTSLFKVKTMFLYLGVIFTGSIVAGWVMGEFWGDMSLVNSHLAHNHEEMSSQWIIISATWLMIGAFGAHYFFSLKYKFSKKKIAVNENELNLKIDKITCENCVKKIDGAISSIPDLVISNVDIKAKTIQVSSSQGLDQEMILSKLNDIGFPAEIIQVENHHLNIKVEDMVCQNCVKKIEGALAGLSDLSMKNVDLETKIIEFESANKIDESLIVSKLKEIGFSSEILGDSDCCH
ncbi:MAG: hypothetical protein COA79_01870 [Planctomycetota bacterium]|nr:MAG: hypothetical protein COA79_01870 [Planctomycetota bacterium]